MADLSPDSTEVSVANVYCVVYKLENADWKVTGEGWSQVHLYKDNSDDTFRLVGWTVNDFTVVINCNLVPSCKYKKKSPDFHKFQDETGNVYGFGFYKKEETLKEAEKFMDTVLSEINRGKVVDEALAAKTVANPLASVAVHPSSHNTAPPTSTSPGTFGPEEPRRGTVMDRINILSQISGHSLGHLQKRPSEMKLVSSPVNSSPASASISPRNAISQPHSPPANKLSNIHTQSHFGGSQKNLSGIDLPGPNPNVHRSESKQLEEYMMKGPPPLGKLRILPPKPAKSASAAPPVNGKGIDITDPHSVIHTQHVKYDASTRRYVGLPPEWEMQLKKQFGLSPNRVESSRVEGYVSRIPTVLVHMKEYLVQNGGLQVEGVFRLAPDADESVFVKQQLNESSFVKCNDINCISNLIKVWFRELPEHILDCADVQQISSCDEEEEASRIIEGLPEPQQSIFKWLLDLSVDVTRQQHINKMSAQNMAIVIGPNLFSAHSNVAPLEALLYSQKVANFLHKSILHRDKYRLSKGL